MAVLHPKAGCPRIIKKKKKRWQCSVLLLLPHKIIFLRNLISIFLDPYFDFFFFWKHKMYVNMNFTDSIIIIFKLYKHFNNNFWPRWSYIEKLTPNPQLLPGRRNINGCPLLQVCVHGVCDHCCVCALWMGKCRARIPSMGHLAVCHVKNK